MGEIAYTCGWCRHLNGGQVVHHHYPYRKSDAYDAKVHVTAACSSCHRTTELTYEFEVEAYSFSLESSPNNEVYWKQRLGADSDGWVSAIVATPSEQFPSLTRNAPTGIDDSTTVAAWNAAEKAVADPPIKGMAYRQVLESALKALEAKSSTPSKAGTPLAKRVEQLIAKDGLPNHLPELIEKARGLGNRAAHEFDDFDRRDVAIIRDLCEAVLRQCFTIPALVERTEQLIEKRKVEATKRAAKAAIEAPE